MICFQDLQMLKAVIIWLSVPPQVHRNHCWLCWGPCAGSKDARYTFFFFFFAGRYFSCGATHGGAQRSHQVGAWEHRVARIEHWLGFRSQRKHFNPVLSLMPQWSLFWNVLSGYLGLSLAEWGIWIRVCKHAACIVERTLSGPRYFKTTLGYQHQGFGFCLRNYTSGIVSFSCAKNALTAPLSSLRPQEGWGGGVRWLVSFFVVGGKGRWDSPWKIHKAQHCPQCSQGTNGN